MKRSSRGLFEKRRRTAFSEDNGWSNDSSDGSFSKERIEVRDGYPVRYKCVNVFEEEDVDADSMQIVFDYELILPKESKSTFAENVRALEWSILWNMVHDIGLNKCDFTKQSLAFERSMPLGGTRRRTQSDLVSWDTVPSYVLSLASDSEDKIDRKTATCKLSPTIDESTVCVPMKGSMQATYTGNQHDLTEQFLLNEVKSVMSSSMMLVEDVQSVTYVGDRSNEGVDGVLGENHSNAEHFVLGSSVSVGVVVMAMVVLFVGLALGRKRRRVLKDKTDFAEENEVPDLGLAETTSCDSSDFWLAETTSCDSSENAIAGDSDIAHIESGEARKAVYPPMGESRESRKAVYPPMEAEQDRIMFVQPAEPSTSVYLASTRQRTRKKRRKKKTNSLRERVSVAPSGIESIPEVDGDVNSSIYDREAEELDSEYSLSSDDEEEYPIIFSPTSMDMCNASPIRETRTQPPIRETRTTSMDMCNASPIFFPDFGVSPESLPPIRETRTQPPIRETRSQPPYWV